MISRPIVPGLLYSVRRYGLMWPVFAPNAAAAICTLLKNLGVAA